MLEITVRDKQHPKRFQGPYRLGEIVDGTVSQIDDPPNGVQLDDVIVLVHGYNNDPGRADDAYRRVASHLTAAMHVLGNRYPNQISQNRINSTEIVGFTWPSNGSALSYLSDLRDARRSGVELGAAIADYLAPRAKRIHLLGHSMGGEVIAYALLSLFEASNSQTNLASITLMGADVPSRWMARDHKYGVVGRIVPRLLNWFSKGDGVVGAVARVVRPWARCGYVGLPDNAPAGWLNADAESAHGSEVNHNTYKDSPAILAQTMAWIYGMPAVVGGR